MHLNKCICACKRMINATNTIFGNMHEVAKFPSIYELGVNADTSRKIKVYEKFMPTKCELFCAFIIFYAIAIFLQ